MPRNLATSFPSSNKTDICGLGHRATVCDPALRTVNTAAECGAAEDVYYYRRGQVLSRVTCHVPHCSPWRAPGSAPVFDSCGMAGGAPDKGGFGAQVSVT